MLLIVEYSCLLLISLNLDLPAFRVPVPSTVKSHDSTAEAIAQSMPRMLPPILGATNGALLRSRSRSNSRNNSLSACQHTTGVGSMSYASPEQINGRFYDEKTDIFSLGIICYQLFSPPFSTRMQRAEEFRSIRSGRIPTSFSVKFPKVAEFIKKCLAPEPADRPSTSDILAMSIWEPAPCMCVKGTSYSVTIPRSTYRRMQDEISRLQKELAQVKEQLAKATAGRTPPLLATPRDLKDRSAMPSPRRIVGRPFKAGQSSLAVTDRPPLVFGT